MAGAPAMGGYRLTAFAGILEGVEAEAVRACSRRPFSIVETMLAAG
jgi:hypothetical protein